MNPPPGSALAEPQQVIADLRRELANAQRELSERTAERDEALAQQAATTEVLGVINSSPGELVPVFEAMLEKVLNLCNAAFGGLWTYDGEQVVPQALRGVSAEMADFYSKPFRPTPVGWLSSLIDGASFVHVSDILDDPNYIAGRSAVHALVDLGNFRSTLMVPLRNDGAFVGVICIYGPEPRPFTDKQIGLLQNFAAQAVIAMENARLLTETREALEQQTATADVLQVINSSPGDLAPVFNAILENAMRICGAAFGMMTVAEPDHLRTVAARGVPDAYREFRRLHPPPASAPIGKRILSGEPYIQTLDAKAEKSYRQGDQQRRALVDLAGARTSLAVTLKNDRAVLGAIHIYRTEVRAFSEKQITLLENFAAQAVIAMENARLITETREALEQQTATAEVLGVINASPGDLAPVFDAMLEKALHLCDAILGTLFTYDGEMMHPAAIRGASPEYSEFLRRGPQRPGGGALGDFVRGKSLHHIPDLKDTDTYRSGDAHRHALVDLGGARALVGVPLRKDAQLLGGLLIYRREPTSFTDKQIALLQNFAAQAVIAMENARLLTETREALEQQTATAEVLGVINSSPGDLAPVFEAMLEKALHLCEAAFGLLHTYDGERFRALAVGGVSEAEAEPLREWVPDPGSALQQIVDGDRTVHIPNVVDTEAYRSGLPSRLKLVQLTGARTALWVALRKDDALLGVFVIYRKEVPPFTDKHIALLQNFAAQAVIAMENARLLDEIRQRQAELRVTFDNMGDGVVMFDAGHRLAAWNRNFQQLLDLPDALLAERPSYADYLRVLAERGEFGTDDVEAELARRLRDTDQELRLERERPDGRVIEVRRNAVTDGGFVLIYSDISEWKRSEAEIRAARDAAEAAYHDLQAAQANLVQAQKMAALGQ